MATTPLAPSAHPGLCATCHGTAMMPGSLKAQQTGPRKSAGPFPGSADELPGAPCEACGGSGGRT